MSSGFSDSSLWLESTRYNGSAFTSTLRQIEYISPFEKSSRSNWLHEKSLAFSAKGMDHLYSMTGYFIDWIQTPGLPEVLLSDQFVDEPERLAKQNRAKILAHMWTAMISVAIGLCLSVIVPMIGSLFFCFSSGDEQDALPSSALSFATPVQPEVGGEVYSHRSSCHSSLSTRSKLGKSYQAEDACDSFCRSFSSVVYFVLLLFISFFVICAFVTNESVRDGINRLPKTLNQSLDDVSLYLNNTQNEINTLFITNYGQVESEMTSNLQSAGVIIKNRFARASQADSLDTLYQIVLKLATLHNGLSKLEHEAWEFNDSLHRLAFTLTQVKQNLEEILVNCTRGCASIQTRYSKQSDQFQTHLRLKNFSALKALTKNVTSLIRLDVVAAVKLGKDNFDDIATPYQRTVNGSIAHVKEEMRKIGQILAQQAGELGKTLRSPAGTIQLSRNYITEAERYINHYEMYRWSVCLVASCMLTFIFVCYLFGYFNGICANQPTVIEHLNQGSKPSSTFFLKLGVYLFFFFFSLLLILVISLAIIGTYADRIGCFYLQNAPNESSMQIASLLQRKLNISLPFDSKTNLAHVFARCKQNHSLYNAFELFLYQVNIAQGDGRSFSGNLTHYFNSKNREAIKRFIISLADKFDYSPENIEIITPEEVRLLETLRDILPRNFTFFVETGHQPLVSLDISLLMSQVKEAAYSVADDGGALNKKLQNIVITLETLKSEVIPGVLHSVRRMKELVAKIELESQFEKRSMKQVLTESIVRAKNAQIFMKKKGSSELTNVSRGFMNNISTLIDQYAMHVVKEIETNVGKCEPVARAVDVSVVALCKKVTLPFNGYWLSMLSILLLFLPTTLLSYILAKLFSKLRADPVKRKTIHPRPPLDIIDDHHRMSISRVTNKHDYFHSHILHTRHTQMSHCTSRSNHSATAPFAEARDVWSSSPPHHQAQPYAFT